MKSFNKIHTIIFYLQKCINFPSRNTILKRRLADFRCFQFCKTVHILYFYINYFLTIHVFSLNHLVRFEIPDQL